MFSTNSTCISPDLSSGGKIVFSRSFDLGITNQIFIMNADRSGVKQLTKNSCNDASPNFSPDGNKIVFVSLRDHANGEIYIMNTDGSNQKRITFNIYIDDYPCFAGKPR